jgi:hypothetical protein
MTFQEERDAQCYDQLEKILAGQETGDDQLRQDAQFLRGLIALSTQEERQPGPFFTQSVLKACGKDGQNPAVAGRSRNPRGYLPPLLLAASLLLAFVLPRWQGVSRGSSPILLDESILEQLAAEEARRALHEHLTRTEMLLVDLRETPEWCGADKVAIAAEKELVRGLLIHHKQFAPQLESLEFLQIRDFFQQLEIILVELNTLQRCSDLQEIQDLNQHIQEQRILTKLRLFAQEISVS